MAAAAVSRFSNTLQDVYTCGALLSSVKTAGHGGAFVRYWSCNASHVDSSRALRWSESGRGGALNT